MELRKQQRNNGTGTIKLDDDDVEDYVLIDIDRKNVAIKYMPWSIFRVGAYT